MKNAVLATTATENNENNSFMIVTIVVKALIFRLVVNQQRLVANLL